MDTLQQNKQNRLPDSLLNLRKRAVSLAEQVESEELLAEAVAIHYIVF